MEKAVYGIRAEASHSHTSGLISPDMPSESFLTQFIGHLQPTSKSVRYVEACLPPMN